MANLKVMIENGEIRVVGVNKDGKESKTQYTVVEVVGLKEFGLQMMQAGAEKQYAEMKKAAGQNEAAATQAPVQEAPKAPQQQPKVTVREVAQTNGQMFTDIKVYGNEKVNRAVEFQVTGKGKYFVGFAKDRNAFMEAYNGVVKATTKLEVLKRLRNYRGEDVATVTEIINQLQPVTMVADFCEACGAGVFHNTKDFSLRHHGCVLCRDCQKGGKRPTKPQQETTPQETPAPQQEMTQAPERSEGATPPPVAQPEQKQCRTCKAPTHNFDICSDCFEKAEAIAREQLRLEAICACGQEKEAVYDKCEECRANTWSATDENQLGLFDVPTKERLDEVVEAVLASYPENVKVASLEDEDIPTLEMDDEHIELPFPEVDIEKESVCGCGAEKEPTMHMCIACTEAGQLAFMEKRFAGNNVGASEASAEGDNAETKVDGDGIAKIDAELLGQLGIK